MAYDEVLAERVRTMIKKEKTAKVEEKKMFGGLCFMVNGKMCVVVRSDSILLKLAEEDYVRAIENNTLEPMLHIGRKMKGFGYVYNDQLRTEKQLQYWMLLALGYNKSFKRSPAKKKKAN